MRDKVRTAEPANTTFSGGIENEQLDYRAVLNGDGNPEYVGYAEPGAGVAEAKWQIRKVTYSPGTSTILTVLHADGSADFNKVWNNRATYTYA